MKRLYGKYAGTVFSNQDPDKRGRLQIYVPKAGFTVDGAGATDWALPCVQHPGHWFGPPANSKVWVEFEAGDPNIPIWSGAFFGAPAGQSELPLRAQGKDDGTQTLIGADSFQTAKGTTKNQPSYPFAPIYPNNHVIIIGDIHLELDLTPQKERILILHPTGSFIEMQHDGVVIIKTNDKQWRTVGADLLDHILGSLFQTIETNLEENVKGSVDRKVGANSKEVVTGNKEIDATQIKLGSGASLTVMLSSIIAKYNGHTHVAPAGGGTTGTPSALFVSGTDDTTKTLAE